MTILDVSVLDNDVVVAADVVVVVAVVDGKCGNGFAVAVMHGGGIQARMRRMRTCARMYEEIK